MTIMVGQFKIPFTINLFPSTSFKTAKEDLTKCRTSIDGPSLQLKQRLHEV